MTQPDTTERTVYEHPIMDPIADSIEGVLESRRITRAISVAGAVAMTAESVYVASTEATMNDTLPLLGIVMGGFAAVAFGRLSRAASRP